MSTILVFKPCSRETQWLLSLCIKPGVSRVLATMRKITRLFHQAHHGNPYDVLVLFRWYQTMRQTEEVFDREIARLTKIIKRKCRDSLHFEPHHTIAYRLKVSTPLSACFYHLLSKYDTVMCLVEACITLHIFKKRRTLFKKQHLYSKGILQFMVKVGEYPLDAVKTKTIALSEKEQSFLALAIQSEMMPLFGKGIFNQLISLTNKTPITEINL